MRWMSALALAVAGCVHIQETESLVETPVAPLVRHETVDGSRTYKLDAHVQGDLLALTVHQSDTCADITVPRTHTTKKIAREADQNTRLTEWATAGTALSLGGFMYGDADSIAANQNSQDSTQMTSPDDVRSAGGVVIGLGVAAAILAIVDEARAADSEEDEGVVNGAPERSEHPCDQSATARERVILHIGDRTIPGTTDDNGRVEFSLTSLPEADLPGATRPIILSVDSALPMLSLEADEIDQIKEALAANPDSRLSIDRKAKHVADCRAALDRVQGISKQDTQRDPDRIMTAWTSAKSTCDRLWTTDNESELVATEQAVNNARCSIALSAAGDLLAEPLDRGTADQVSEKIDAAGADCSQPADLERLKATKQRLAPALKRLEQAEAEAAEQQQLEQDIGSVADALRNQQPEQAWVLLQREPKLRKLVDEDLRNLARAQLSQALDDVLSANPSLREAQVEMCYSRRVFSLVVGDAELRAEVQEFVANAAATQAARVVQALKSGRCN